MLIKKYSFPKKKRVFKKKTISELFENQNTLMVFPFKVIYNFIDESDYPLKVLITIPKKLQKNAVDRNKIKRQAKEAWRLNCISLIDAVSKTQNTLIVGLIYVHNKKINSSKISIALKKILNMLIDVVNNRYLHNS